MEDLRFQLPDELILTPVLQSFPCRERQTRTLAALLHPDAAPCRNLTLHGVEATGKTAITRALLASMSKHVPTLRYAIVHAGRCITARHLFESVVAAVAEALEGDEAGPPSLTPSLSRCETLAQLDVQLCRLLKYPIRGERFHFVLVLDAIDEARDAPPTLMPALARLSEIIPCLTTVFIVTSPPAHFLRTTPTSPALLFPPYTKLELVRILSLTPPSPPSTDSNPSQVNGNGDSESSPSILEQADIDNLWPRFCAAVHDALVQPAARSLPAFRSACQALWPRFIAPVTSGSSSSGVTVKDFPKLLVAARAHFQDESVLNPSIVAVRPQDQYAKPAATTSRPSSAVGRRTPTKVSSTSAGKPATNTTTTDLAALLPRTARILLLCAYLASHNPPRHDLTLFSTHHRITRKRRPRNHAGGGTGSHRKIARKLLGAHAFVLERMLAIYAAVRTEWLDEDANDQADDNIYGQRRRGGLHTPASSLDGDVGAALATLSSLRLLNRVGAAGDVMDRGAKWRINVGWEVVRGVGRSMGVEVEEWLME